MYRFYFNKTKKSVGIGPYPKVTLNIARTVASEYKSLVLAGKNPAVEKKVRTLRQLASASCERKILLQKNPNADIPG